MSDRPPSKSSMGTLAGAIRPGRWGQIWRLATKELKETLRDRRTLVTLVVMPLIVYPILSLLFRTFLLNSLGAGDTASEIKYRIAVRTDSSPEELKIYLEHLGRFALLGQPRDRRPAAEETGASTESLAGQAPQATPDEQVNPASALPAVTRPAERREVPLEEHEWNLIEDPELDPAELLSAGQADLVIAMEIQEGPRKTSDIQIFYDPNSPFSRRAARYLQSQFETINRVIFQAILQAASLDARREVRSREIPLTTIEAAQPSNNFTAIIPLVLVLMTITGAVYPAIDLTAGERERGTLETLVAAPIPRMRILVAKLVAVLSVAVLTASLNVIGMLITIWTFRLDTMLIGEGGLTLEMMIKVFGLLILFAAFFSAILLVVTSFARSFKEAQAYLIPIILLSLGPGLLTLSPGLKLAGPLAVCPMVNILLLARDVLQNQVALLPAGVAIFSTVIYGVVAISLAASIFGTDNILYGSGSSWREMLIRPAEPRPRATANLALFCLLLLFPINFVLIGLLGRLSVEMQTRLLYTAAFTGLAFCGVPLLMAWHQRVALRSGFGLVRPGWPFVVIGILLGLSLSPLVMQMISAWHELIKLVSGEAEGNRWHETIVNFSREQVALFRQAPAGLILISFSLVPAFCEEFFFRGMLQRALLTSNRPWIAILFSALAFGAFHTLSGSVAAFERLIPTSIVGLALGLLAYKSNSIWPGVGLHLIHNAIVAFLAYYQPQLEKLPGFPGEDEAIPVSWTIGAAIIAAFALGWLLRSRLRESSSHSPVAD